MNIIGHKNFYLAFAGLLVGAALVFIYIFGFHQAIDFSGGTLWQFKIPSVSETSEVKNIFQTNLGLSEAIVNFESTHQSFLVRLKPINETDHQKYKEQLQKQYPGFEELSFQFIGPAIGQELRRRSLITIGLVLAAISLYIAVAFRKVSRPVQSWKYGFITLLTLFHDVAIPAGFLAFLGWYKGIEIDTNFIVALLVIMGFSVHDTIVVFDRIRENLALDRGKTEFSETANRSINQTLARSINTSLTLVLVLLALYFVGPPNLRYFVLTLLIGVSLGAYSSIFVASPLLVVWHNFKANRSSRPS